MTPDVQRGVLVVQLGMRPRGGGIAVGAWMLDALRAEQPLGVFSWDPLDVEALNRYYGTTLDAGSLRVYSVPAWLRTLIRHLEVVALPTLKVALARPFVLRAAAGYGTLVSVGTPFDFGRPGIQYLHLPTDADPEPPLFGLRHPAWRWVARAYRTLCSLLSGSSEERWRRNRTLTNSTWTARQLLERSGLECGVLHPPAGRGFVSRPWPERAPHFACIGRIYPDKELEKVMEIVARVRRQVPDAELHLLGNGDTRDYVQRVRERAAAHGPWVHLHLDRSRAELLEVVSRCRYGIHGMSQEHYGIAVAELVHGGCIPFVPADGGPPEIVGDELLTYDGIDQAVSRILQVVGDPGLQTRLLQHLEARRAETSTERFVSRARGVVADFQRAGRA